jgi:uncharacterized protein YndB with AHSA1/START domain
MKPFQCKTTCTIAATPNEVFDALTNAKTIIAWSGGQKGKVEPTIGGKFEFFDGWVKGTVLAYERGKRLSYTWLPNEWPAGTLPSVVKYTFVKAAKGTRVTLTHSGFPNATELSQHKSGWIEHVFDPLKKHFAR